MSMYTLLRNKPIPKMEDIETYFQVKSGESIAALQVQHIAFNND